MKLQSVFTWNVDPLTPFSDGPILSLTDPPLLPDNVVDAGYVTTTSLPWQRLISKIAACGAGPEFNNITCPVAVLFPCQSTVTLPPELPLLTRQKEPKLSAWVE
jgi:hypothetical protein